MNEQQYPHLKHLLGGYLHQDWNLEFSTPEDAIAAFKNAESPETIQGACRELDDLIPLVSTMQDPHTFLWQVLWCYYSPKVAGLTVPVWLERVRQQLCKLGK